MLVIHFLEAMQIQQDEAQGLTVTSGAIEFLFECFGEEPPIVEIGERIGDGVELEFFQVVVFDEDGNTKKTHSSEDIYQSGDNRNLTIGAIAELAAAREHVIPDLQTLSFAQIQMSDHTEVSLEKLTTRRQIESIERIGKQLEIRILNRQARGRRGAGAGHIRYGPNLCLSRGVWGKLNKFSTFMWSNQESIRTGPGRATW